MNLHTAATIRKEGLHTHTHPPKPPKRGTWVAGVGGSKLKNSWGDHLSQTPGSKLRVPPVAPLWALAGEDLAV